MTLTLLLSVTSLVLPPARLLLEQGKIDVDATVACKQLCFARVRFHLGWLGGRGEGGCMHVCPVLVYILYMLYFHLVVSASFVSSSLF